MADVNRTDPAEEPPARTFNAAITWTPTRKRVGFSLLAIMAMNAFAIFIVVLFHVLGRTMEYVDPVPESEAFLLLTWLFIFLTPIILLASLAGTWFFFFRDRYLLSYLMSVLPLINVGGSYAFLSMANALNGM